MLRSQQAACARLRLGPLAAGRYPAGSQCLGRSSTGLVKQQCHSHYGLCKRRSYSDTVATASAVPPPPPPPTSTTFSGHARGQGGGSSMRRGVFLALFGLTFSALGAAAAWRALTARGLGFYSDEESLQRFKAADAGEEAQRVEDFINSHPLVTQLRSQPELTESRPHMKMPAQYRQRSLTGNAILGPGKVPVPPFTWTEDGGKSFVSVLYIGEDLCGHPGIVHGGLLATILDEGLAWCCMGALPHRIGMTANLNINYRKPVMAGSYVVLRAETTKVEGRKAWLQGQLELLAGPGEVPTVLADATALFVSPKNAALIPRIH